MRLSRAISLLAVALPLASADVKFTTPAAGLIIPGGTAFPVVWADSGAAPALADLTAYTLFLFSGSNAAPSQLYQLAASTFAAGSTVTVTVPPGTGGTGPNS